MISFKEYFYYHRLNENSGLGGMQAAEINNKRLHTDVTKGKRIFHFGHGEYGINHGGKYIATHRHNPETGNLDKLSKPETYSKIEDTPEHPATAHDMTDKSHKSIGRGAYKRVYDDPKDEKHVTAVAGLGSFGSATKSSKLADLHHIHQCIKNQSKPEPDKHLPKIGSVNADHPDIVQYKTERLHDVLPEHDHLNRHVSALHNRLDELENHTGDPIFSRDKDKIKSEIENHKKSIQEEIDKHPELQKHNSADSIYSSLSDLVKQRRLANKLMGINPGNPLSHGDGIEGDLHSGNIMYRHHEDRAENGKKHKTLVWNDPHVSVTV